MLLCNKVQTLFHRTRLMGINPWSTVVRFYQRTVGAEYGRVIHSVPLESPVKTPLPVTIVSKRPHTIKRRNYILMLPTETVVVFLLNGWVVITGRKKKQKPNKNQKKKKTIGSGRLISVRTRSWTRLVTREVSGFQVSWIKHHFYTTLFCFTQCALKISNNIAISIQSCVKCTRLGDKPLQVS